MYHFLHYHQITKISCKRISVIRGSVWKIKILATLTFLVDVGNFFVLEDNPQNDI